MSDIGCKFPMNTSTNNNKNNNPTTLTKLLNEIDLDI